MSDLARAVGAALGAEVCDLRRVSGGSINDAFTATLDDGRRAFVKTRAGAEPEEFATEADGLSWLAEPGAVPVPTVLGLGEDPPFLAVEWVEPGTLGPDGAEELGRGLAALHAAGAPAFGAGRPLRLAQLVLPSDPSEDWPSFYAERRLAPLAARAGLEAAVEPVCERIHELAGPPEEPARLHGDLWGGNVLAGADGRAWLIDPLAYGGHREVDLAMLRLFGAPSPRVFAAYEEVAPLADGHEERVALYQLFPLLLHAALFGGSYVERARATARALAD